MGDIKNFFESKTFAVIGASRHEGKVGHTVFKNLIQANKQAFPINPKASSILGKKCYKDIFEVPYNIDTVIIAVPKSLVPLSLKQAGEKGAKTAIILTAGFSETGDNSLEKELEKISKTEGIQIVGPNSYGIIDPHQNLNTTYYKGKIKKGEIALLSQSGAIGSMILDKQVPLSGFVSVGNSSTLGFKDFIKYYNSDIKTKVLALYIESLKKGEGPDFIKACKESKKPIIVLKSGKSLSGQKAAASHTASLASEAGIYSGVFRQAGIIEVDSITQLIKASKILTKYSRLGNKAIIITNAGGPGVLTADACSENKIKLIPLSTKTISSLNETLPQSWSKNNPIDMIGTALAKDYSNTISIAEKENPDFIITLLTPQEMTEPLATAKTLLKSKSPIFACFLGGEQLEETKKFMNQFGIINFSDPKEMCDTLGKIIS